MQENVSRTHLCCQQRAVTTTLSTTFASDTLFIKRAAQIGVHQAALHFADGLTQSCVVEMMTPLPTCEVPSLEDIHP